MKLGAGCQTAGFTVTEQASSLRPTAVAESERRA
jgi:hypothetical protein